MPEEKTQHQIAMEYWAGFPEAPYSTSFKWIDGNGFEQLTTVRSYGAKTLLSQVDGLIGEIILRGGVPTNQRPQAAPPAHNAPREPVARDEGMTVAEIVQQSAEAVPPAPNGQQWQTMTVNRLVILALPDNLYSLELYQSGHKYPDLKVSKRKLEVIAGYIKHITKADASKPQDLGINATAYYCNGKPKDNGGFWLDLHHLRPN